MNAKDKHDNLYNQVRFNQQNTSRQLISGIDPSVGKDYTVEMVYIEKAEFDKLNERIKALVEALETILDEVNQDCLNLSTFSQYNAQHALSQFHSATQEKI